MINLNIDHYEPRMHPRMSMESRAAQFSAFQALTGFYDKIDLKNVVKIDRKILSNDIKSKLDEKLKVIENNLDKEVEITYYSKDKYIKVTSYIKKIDTINKEIILVNKTIIDTKNIIDLKIV